METKGILKSKSGDDGSISKNVNDGNTIRPSYWSKLMDLKKKCFLTLSSDDLIGSLFVFTNT